MLSLCRQTDGQTDNGKKICPDLSMQGHRNHYIQLAYGVCFQINCIGSGIFKMVKCCKKMSHDALHDDLFIVCRCQNSSADCQPGLKTKMYE